MLINEMRLALASSAVMAVLACRRWLEADSKLCRMALTMALLPLPSPPPLSSFSSSSGAAAARASALSFLEAEAEVKVSPLDVFLGLDFLGRLY